MLNKDGVAIKEQVMSKFPSIETLVKPKAIIECYENIACNPCSTSCPFEAIAIGADINTIPVVDFDKCTGCGICAYSCPGLAIIIGRIKENKALFKIPYEFLPAPIKGEVWHAINREGKIIGEALIEKVDSNLRQDKTLLVHVEVDRNLLYDFVTIRRKEDE
ncbi:MAG: 4Fe-4S binding protein [Bacilli bacterium]|nr:4Fe-4S binding protein [Bacilli bacterium]